MGVDTKGRMSNKHGVKDIQRALKYKLNINSEVKETYSKDYYIISFNYKDEHRELSVFENYKDDYDGKIGTHLSFRKWGSSIEIMRSILEMFGGDIQENDCEDEWEYVSPSDKMNLTEEELLEDKLFSRLSNEDTSYVVKRQIVNYIKRNLDFIKSL